MTDRPGPAHHPLVSTVAALLVLQAVGVLAVAVSFALDLGAGALNLAGQIFLVVLVALGGLWLGVVGIGLYRGQAWTRAAAVVIELFAVILSVSYLSAGNWVTGALFLVPAAVVLVLLFSVPVGAHLSDRSRN